MLRIIRWSLIAAYLIVVGLWPAAAVPVALLAAGLVVIAASIPLPIWLAAIGVVLLVLYRRSTPTVQPAG